MFCAKNARGGNLPLLIVSYDCKNKDYNMQLNEVSENCLKFVGLMDCAMMDNSMITPQHLYF